jgi:hypothetical protein
MQSVFSNQNIDIEDLSLTGLNLKITKTLMSSVFSNQNIDIEDLSLVGLNLKIKKLIQVDIGGHPPFPNGSKQFSGHFGNLLFLAGFHFWGHFEGLNEVF